MSRRVKSIIASLLATGLLVLLACWGSVVWSVTPLAQPLSQFLAWPVACTTRGCITTKTWQQHEKARSTFNQALNLPQATSAETMTTLIRQHLVSHAVVRSAVTTADARRYREEILNAKDAAAIERATTLTRDEYDQLVVLPFLQQEALRQQQHAETADELFHQLAQDRFVIVFVRGLRWNKEEGKVIATQ